MYVLEKPILHTYISQYGKGAFKNYVDKQVSEMSTLLNPIYLFSWALCDDHTPRATSPAAFCHNLANFVQNSNFYIAMARAEGSLAPAMSKLEF